MLYSITCCGKVVWGEVTQETRIYALPFLNSPLALATQFRYDSWGRVDSIFYPDGERLNYQYDLGGQLQSITNNSSNTYLDNVTYDKFGAKISQEYGNGLVTSYTYDSYTRRLSQITVADNSNNPYGDIQYGYDPVGNVTQANSTCPWLPNHTFTETFTYDASDQLTSATESQNQSYQLEVTYGNWGKISGYSLAQTDLQHNTTQSEVQAYTYPATNSIGSSQTLFAPQQRTITDANNNVSTETLTFGINGSLRKREVSHPQASYTEYYLFNSAANLKAYSNNGLDFAYYGYNASNTRSYKLNFLNANSWVNGQQLPIHPQSIQAMFYPNAYLNFNQSGEYTKHYYNGTERIASRLGNTALSISMEMTDRLQERVGKLETRFQDDIRELVYTNVQVETPPVSVSSLQSTGTATDIFYYHTNHLGSTAYVTDNNATITQGFLYTPFGEITTEYAPLWQNGTLPKYSFNAKELDEETGMYYYEARYYKPPVFTSRDPMFEKYFWMTPYAYCANNPVKYVDPDGCASILPDPIKKSISKAITTSAEYAHALYNRAASIVQSHPQWISKVNRSLSSIKKGVEKVTDMNPKTMGWLDLTNIWLFELGNTSEYTFGPEANTTKQLMKQAGVEQARETAHNNIKNGKFGIINHPWSYDTEQFYEGMSEGNAVTSFLGSYTTTVNITPGKNAGEFILNFEVKNTSSWESATRLRKDNDGNGNHDGIIPSKERGVGIHLGGNLRQTWKWSEPFSVN